MKTVSAEYAAGHLSELLGEVAAGEEILIAMAGIPVARLSPAGEPPREQELTPEAPSEEVEQAFHGD
jgi:antitoxin (DNA-binding transcriptional repressor) of toxin-antitoxin stability system